MRSRKSVFLQLNGHIFTNMPSTLGLAMVSDQPYSFRSVVASVCLSPLCLHHHYARLMIRHSRRQFWLELSGNNFLNLLTCSRQVVTGIDARDKKGEKVYNEDDGSPKSNCLKMSGALVVFYLEVCRRRLLKYFVNNLSPSCHRSNVVCHVAIKIRCCR